MAETTGNTESVLAQLRAENNAKDRDDPTRLSGTELRRLAQKLTAGEAATEPQADHRRIGQQYPTRLGELFDFYGVLAQHYGTFPEQDAPMLKTCVRISSIPAADWPGIVGQVPWSPSNNWALGEVRLLTGGRASIDCREWTWREFRKPIPKPADGKEYTWRWSSVALAWLKDSFPMCDECRHVHAPDRQHCSWCGQALNKGKTGTCSPNHEELVRGSLTEALEESS